MAEALSTQSIEALNRETQSLPPANLLAWAAQTFPGTVAFASSLGLEDQVLMHMIAQRSLALPIFTLDTGRLFLETYDLIDRTRLTYGLNIRILFPDASAVEEMVNEHGPNLFLTSVELRKRCCAIRKIEPLRRALSGLQAWVCGLRRDQAVTRGDLRVIEWDAANGLVKINPLADWSEEQVREYIKENKVPYNPLHDRGFPSIGCACCTRAIAPGEDIRAGRWWWENPEHKECGLHQHKR